MDSEFVFSSSQNPCPVKGSYGGGGGEIKTQNFGKCRVWCQNICFLVSWIHFRTRYHPFRKLIPCIQGVGVKTKNFENAMFGVKIHVFRSAESDFEYVFIFSNDPSLAQRNRQKLEIFSVYFSETIGTYDRNFNFWAKYDYSFVRELTFFFFVWKGYKRRCLSSIS